VFFAQVGYVERPLRRGSVDEGLRLDAARAMKQWYDCEQSNLVWSEEQETYFYDFHRLPWTMTNNVRDAQDVEMTVELPKLPEEVLKLLQACQVE